jgi:hypothetical protein
LPAKNCGEMLRPKATACAQFQDQLDASLIEDGEGSWDNRHPLFARREKDLTITVPVTIAERIRDWAEGS